MHRSYVLLLIFALAVNARPLHPQQRDVSNADRDCNLLGDSIFDETSGSDEDGDVESNSAQNQPASNEFESAALPRGILGDDGSEDSNADDNSLGRGFNGEDNADNAGSIGQNNAPKSSGADAGAQIPDNGRSGFASGGGSSTDQRFRR
jgi:hypothetical protein